MRTVEEFKRDQAQWKRDSDRKNAQKVILNWVIGIIVLIAAAVGGLKIYQHYKPADTAQPSDATAQPGGTTP